MLDVLADVSARPRLLLVEDNESTIALQRLMLKDDFEVVAAKGFDQAVELFLEKSCQVALLDIDLGEMRSGVDLLRRLREIPGAANLVAVACTAYALPGCRSKFLGAGFNEYISKPFTKAQLIETIRRALGREAMDARLDHQQQIELRLPPPPATFPEIVRMLARHDPVPDTRRLIEVLERDPLTVFWVLRHLNSAYYGLRRKVGEVDRAVAMLGHDPICNLVLTEVVTQTFSTFSSDAAQVVYRHVFKTSVAAASIARHLGYSLEVERAELAFSIGLLHQLGRMALLSSNGDQYIRLWDERRGGSETPVSPTREQETHSFGQDYARIGAEVARAWHLPEDIIEVIRYHRDSKWSKSVRTRTLSLLVSVGHFEALRLFEIPSEDIAQTRAEEVSKEIDELCKLLHVNQEGVKQALASCEEEVRDFVAAFTKEQEQRKSRPAA